MPSTATVTGKTGAGLTMTAQVFNGVTAFSLNTETEMLEIRQGPVVTMIDVSAATTWTLTVSAPNSYTLTVS